MHGRRSQQGRQPQIAAKVNPGSRLAQSLCLCAIPASSRFLELITGQITPVSGAIEIGDTIDGNRETSTFVNSPGLSSKFSHPTKADAIIGPWSVFAEIAPRVDNINTNPVYASGEDGSGNGFTVAYDDAGVVYDGLTLSNDYFGAAAGSTYYAIGVDSWKYRHRVMWVWDGSNALFYAKRALNRSTAYAVPPVTNSNRRSHIATGAAGRASVVGVSLVAVWGRALGLTEFQSLWDNPWQLIAPYERRVWVPAALGASVPNITAVSAESITATSADYRVTLDFA